MSAAATDAPAQPSPRAITLRDVAEAKPPSCRNAYPARASRMTPKGPWTIKCERCGKNDAEHGEFFPFIVFDERSEQNIVICEDCRRPDDLEPVSWPTNRFG